MPLYKGHNAIIKKDGSTIGYVTDIEINLDRSVEPYFSIQSRIASEFVEGVYVVNGRISKAWIDLLFLDLLQGTPELDSFELEVLLPTMKIKLENCKISKGSLRIPQDGFLSEEYDFIASTPSISEWPEGGIINFEEPLDSGYFKNKAEVWFNQETGGYVGYPIYIPETWAEQGGGYFER